MLALTMQQRTQTTNAMTKIRNRVNWSSAQTIEAEDDVIRPIPDEEGHVELQTGTIIVADGRLERSGVIGGQGRRGRLLQRPRAAVIPISQRFVAIRAVLVPVRLQRLQQKRVRLGRLGRDQLIEMKIAQHVVGNSPCEPTHIRVQLRRQFIVTLRGRRDVVARPVAPRRESPRRRKDAIDPREVAVHSVE